MAVPRNGSRPHASLDLESSGSRGWIADAPCADMPGKFDVPDGLERVALEIWSRPLLEMCRACPFKRPCIEHVDPGGSRNNIVSGGLVWRKGYPVKFRRRVAPGPAPTQPCGTLAAYKRHHRHGEQPCPECCDVWAAYCVERRAARREAKAS